MGHPTALDGTTNLGTGCLGAERPAPRSGPDGLPVDDDASGTTIRHEAPLLEFDLDEDEAPDEDELDVRSDDITLFT